MTGDRSWMTARRASSEYQNGVKEFLDLAFSNVPEGRKTWCPCKLCINRMKQERVTLHYHLLKNGFMHEYTIWREHGELTLEEDGDEDNNEEEDLATITMLENLITATDNITRPQSMDWGSNSDHCIEVDTPNPDAEKFYKLIEEAQMPLYPGSDNFTKLTFVLELYHLKCRYGISRACFNAQLSLFKKALPKENNLPESEYEVVKMIKDLGLGYDKIDACKNDCILFRGAHSNLDCCPKCKQSRWVEKEGNGSQSIGHRKIPVKTLRHFPLIPRLQRLFMTKSIAKDMRWHEVERVKDQMANGLV